MSVHWGGGGPDEGPTSSSNDVLRPVPLDEQMVKLLPMVLTYDPETPLGKAVVTVYSITASVVGNDDRAALIKVLVEFERLRTQLALETQRVEIFGAQRETVLTILDDPANLVSSSGPGALVQKIRTALMEMPDLPQDMEAPEPTEPTYSSLADLPQGLVDELAKGQEGRR